MEQVKTQEIAAPGHVHRRRWLTRDRLTALLMIAPSAIAIAVFVYGFIGWTGYISLTKWASITPDYTFVGFKNYVDIFNTGRFQTDIRNTIVFTAFFLVGCLALGLLLAMLIDSHVKGEAIFRSIYIFPMSLSFIVTGVAWLWIFTPGNYPTDPTGILAGLRGISEEIKEAARVDGASEWQVFRHVILPLLQPVTLSAVIILGHISLKIFDLILTMTHGGPGNATDVPGTFMYEITFKANQIARGAAVAIVMLLLVAVLIVPYLIYNARTEVEQ